MTEKLKSLYQSVILHHNKAPIGYEKHPEADNVLEAYNPICGDRFTLFFDVEEDQIKDMYYHGFGCAISKASSSILVKHLKGKSLDEARQLVEDYFRTVNGEAVDVPEDFTAFAAAKSFPGRMKCATLSWDALQQFLNEKT
jgi:nitrogen fixation NifU-like protein